MDNGMLGGDGIIGSMVSKLDEETQSRWFLYLGEESGREEQEAFNIWLTIDVRAAEIYRQRKMAEAWFRAEANYQLHPNEVTGICKDERSRREEGSAGYMEGHEDISAAEQNQQLGAQCGVGHAHLRIQRKSKHRRGRKRPPSGDSQRSREHGTKQRQGIIIQCASTSHFQKKTAAAARKSNSYVQLVQPRGGAASCMSETHHRGISEAKDARNKHGGARGLDKERSTTAQRRRRRGPQVF